MATEITHISAAKNSDTKPASEPSSSSQDVVVDCLSTYAQVYRETLTPELVIAFQNCMEGLNPEILHRAFLRAMRSSTFRPTPAEVLQAYAVEFENAPKPKQLDLPEMSEKDRDAIQGLFDALRQKLRIPSQASLDTRRRELAKQKEQILAKHPGTRPRSR